MEVEDAEGVTSIGSPWLLGETGFDVEGRMGIFLGPPFGCPRSPDIGPGPIDVRPFAPGQRQLVCDVTCRMAERQNYGIWYDRKMASSRVFP